MTPQEFLDFQRQAAANECDQAMASLGKLIDQGDRLITQFAAEEVISQTAMLIREQERGNPTT